MNRFSKMFSVITELPSARAEENHGLCLHVGREAGERQRLDINRTDAPGAMHADALIGALDVDTHKLELLEDHTEMGSDPSPRCPRDRRQARRRR